jgi:uncharacterized protein YqgC (DUF456 family)
VTWVEVLCAVAILIGLLGIVVPVLPGVLIIAGALLVWAYSTNTGLAWGIAWSGVVVLAVGAVIKYAVPHRRLKEAGVPRRTLVLGVVLGIVGFFVIPVIGLFIGFVGGVWLAESNRLGRSQAWPSTKAALKATGLSIVIELASGLLAAALFIGGVVAT